MPESLVTFDRNTHVLHNIACTSKDLFRHAPRLSAVLRDHPDIEVIVSSDWRKGAGSVAELAAHFAADVRHRFVGFTSIESDATEQRGSERECWQWLCAHGREHQRWIAVDDWPESFGPDLAGAGAVLFTEPSTDRQNRPPGTKSSRRPQTGSQAYVPNQLVQRRSDSDGIDGF